MENSLNSSSPEPTVSGLKSVFKKPANFYQAFEVSIDESVTAGTQNNTSDADLDTASRTNKRLPFKRSRKSIQKPFSVTSDESFVNSESEQSVTSAKPHSVFAKKNKSIVDFFNVSYNETNISSQADVSSKTVDESNIVHSKKNPFKKRSESENGILVGNESSVGDFTKETRKSGLEKSQTQSVNSFDGDEADSTTLVSVQNPFEQFIKKKNYSITQLHLSSTDENKFPENKTTEIDTQSTINNSESDTTLSVTKSKMNPFKQVQVQNSNSVMSITNERSDENSVEDTLLANLREASKNTSFEPSISKQTNNTSYLEQSSINDDNLNNWMSDASDEEMPVARIPSLPANLSPTKEKPVSTPATELNPLSVWEQKLSEIVSNAQKKSQAVKLQMNSNVPQKSEPFKKLDKNVEKSAETENKYKPARLLKPASFATKKLYNHIIKKLEPKYGIDTMLESENLVLSICDIVKKVTRRKTHQKRLIQQLKKEMAETGLIETTMDFYEFVIKFLPYSFRLKAVPCLQPVTNVVYPPKDVLNPFDKIL